MKLVFRLVTGVLIFLAVAIIGVGGWFTYEATQLAQKADKAGWFEPRPDGDTPLNLFEQTAARAMFGKSWNATGFPCRSVAREWVGTFGDWKDAGPMPVSQLLARDIRFEIEGSRSLSDGVRKLALACTLETRYNDAQLLRMWTRRMSFTQSVTGVEAASVALLKKPVAALDEKQAATLVSLVEAPGLFRNPDKLKARADHILERSEQNR